jgi:hypothetical protein
MPDLLTTKQEILMREGSVELTGWDHEKQEPYRMLLPQSEFERIQDHLDRQAQGVKKRNRTRQGTWP